MKKKFFICFACVLNVILLRAQALDSPPEWTKGYFKELQNSYIEVVSGTATDRETARNKAVQMVIERRNLATGQRVEVNVSGGNVTVNSNGELTVKARVIDEFVNHKGPGEWEVYLLVQTSKHPNNVFEPVTVTDRYPFSPRSFVPGMAQLDKGQTGKGLGFILGEVASLGGIVACEGMRSYNVNKATSTHNIQQRMAYTDRANYLMISRNVFIASAAAVYVWNVVDAIVAKGPRRVLLSESAIRCTPYASSDGVGFAMNISF